VTGETLVSDRLESLLKFHPFTRLNALLQGIEPGGKPLALSVGEPQAPPPAFLAEILEREKAGWARYPQSAGTPEFRAAAADWLGWRYHLPEGLIDRDAEIMPCAGSREALFHIALATVPEWQGRGARPAVLMPNPFYHVYAGAAAVAGAEPVFLPATAANGFQPDPDAVPAEVLARTALAYVCSPANPQGAVAGRERLARWLALGRQHGFTVAFDECYAEIYFDQPPAGALEVAEGSTRSPSAPRRPACARASSPATAG
jgi:N-succinyldiaminopimelate aminotransferase